MQELILSGLQSEKGLKRYTREDKSKVKVILEQLGITHLSNKQIGELSGGELQRALLGRAIISEPKLLVLDEPTNFVDNQFENELYNLLHHLSEKMAIIMVSHDVHNISSAVKSIVCVNRTIHKHNTNTLSSKDLDDYCFVK